MRSADVQLALPAAAAAPANAFTGMRSTVTYTRSRQGPWLQVLSFAGFEWNRVEMSLPGLPAELDGVRMIHLTDLHLRKRWPKQLDEVIERLNADPPELVLCTGDWVDDKRDHRAALPLVRRLVQSLKPRAGIYSILGNHDGDLMAPRLHAMGVHVIVHQRIDVALRGVAGAVELIGFPGPDRVDYDERWVSSLPPRREGVPRVVLGHYPDMVYGAAPLAPDLYLAGHTHGGQVCLPNQRAILTHDSLPRRLAKGAHEVAGTWLVVNRGFGFTDLPVRVCCPAEVIEVVLKSS